MQTTGDIALSAGRDPARADRVIDPREGANSALRAALTDVDVVVNAAGLDNPGLAMLIAGPGIPFVDITASTGYVAALERLDPPQPLLVSVGLAPGLTNLLAVAVHATAPGPVDVVLMLGAGERHGSAATAWSYGLLARRFRDPADGKIRNYSRSRHFDLPGYGRRRLYRTDFSDQHVLTRDLGVPVRTYFGLDSRLATAALAVLTWVPWCLESATGPAPAGHRPTVGTRSRKRWYDPVGPRPGPVAGHGGGGGDRHACRH